MSKRENQNKEKSNYCCDVAESQITIHNNDGVGYRSDDEAKRCLTVS